MTASSKNPLTGSHSARLALAMAVDTNGPGGLVSEIVSELNAMSGEKIPEGAASVARQTLHHIVCEGVGELGPDIASLLRFSAEKNIEASLLPPAPPDDGSVPPPTLRSVRRQTFH